MSPHELARYFVIEKLVAQEEAEDTREVLARIEAVVDSGRRELALATAAILQFGGKATREDAEKFLREKMKYSRPNDQEEADETSRS